ncbi:MAG TPA: hypothetical protein VGK34_09115 [Armatimonadota bacterium]
MKYRGLIIALCTAALVFMGGFGYVVFRVASLFGENLGFSTPAYCKSMDIPNGSNARTQAYLDKKLDAFHKRTVLDAYRQYGVHDNKWDAAAEKFLASYITSLSRTASRIDYGLISAEGNAAVELGCPDPLVRSCYGMSLCCAGKAKDGMKALNESLDLFAQSKYPKYRAWLVPLNILRYNHTVGSLDSPEKIKEMQDLTIKWYGESFGDKSYQPGDDEAVIEIAINRIGGDCGSELADRWTDLDNSMHGKTSTCPYAEEVLSGYWQIQAAWQSRGGDWADKVTEEGWRGFETHLDSAREILTRAWKSHPEYPQAPDHMISVTMGRPKRGESERLWFERCVTAQMDYMDAYNAYAWSIRPRWGGSLEELYDFGVECLNTKRFDTQVPWQFVQRLRDITEDSEGDNSCWKKPETVKYLNTLFAGYAKSPYEKIPGTTMSQAAAAAWYSRRYSDAKQILDKLGKKVNPDAFAHFAGVPYNVTCGEIYSLGGTIAPKVLKANQLADKGKLPEAISIYKGLLIDKGTSPDALPYLKKQLSFLNMRNDFLGGKWVEFKPDREFTGWIIPGGCWQVRPDGSIEGTSNPSGLMLQPDVDFGSRWEITGEVEFVSQIYDGSNACVTWNYHGSRWNDDFVSAFIDRDYNNILLKQGFDKRFGAVSNMVDKKDTFAVRMWDGQTRFIMNDKLQQATGTVPKYPSQANHRIGIGGDYWVDGTVLRFRNVRIHRLTQRPS